MDVVPLLGEALDAAVKIVRERDRRKAAEGEPLPTAARTLDTLDKDFADGKLTREEYDRQRQAVVTQFLGR